MLFPANLRETIIQIYYDIAKIGCRILWQVMLPMRKLKEDFEMSNMHMIPDG